MRPQSIEKARTTDEIFAEITVGNEAEKLDLHGSVQRLLALTVVIVTCLLVNWLAH